MKAKFWKILSVVFLIMWSVLGVYVIINSYKEGRSWEFSFQCVAEYLLLNLTKDVINLNVDEDKLKDN